MNDVRLRPFPCETNKAIESVRELACVVLVVCVAKRTLVCV